MRAGVAEDFPEIALIPDDGMRARAEEAWSYALGCSKFHRMTDIPPEGNPGAPMLREGTQADHLRGVGRTAKVIAEQFA
jgi:hypothetical protein